MANDMLASPLLRIPLALPLALSLHSPASAASVSAGGDSTMGCLVTLTGEIDTGDTERLVRAVIAAQEHRRAEAAAQGRTIADQTVFVAQKEDDPLASRNVLCLDSPGGSVTAALNIVDSMLTRKFEPDPDAPGGPVPGYLETAIGPGAQCLSACALVFMAGLRPTESDAGDIPARTLHVRGKLGFHAPGLHIPDGSYTEGTVARAFDIAIEAVRQIAARMPEMRMRDSLFRMMVSTPNSDMAMIDTVGEAAEWMISTAGLPPLARPTAGNMLQACYAVAAGDLPSIAWQGTWDSRPERFLTADSGSLLAAWFAGEYVAGLDASGAEFRETFDRPGFRTFLFDSNDDGLGAIECTGDLSWKETGALPGQVAGHVTLAAGASWSVPFDEAALYPWEMRLDALAHIPADRPVDPSMIVMERSETGATTCADFGRTGGMTTVEACTYSGRILIRADATLEITLEFTWPSGTTTVLSRGPDGTQINGTTANSTWVDTTAAGFDPDAPVSCTQSQDNGKTMCFPVDG